MFNKPAGFDYILTLDLTKKSYPRFCFKTVQT